RQAAPRDPPAFPTRRASDLGAGPGGAAIPTDPVPPDPPSPSPFGVRMQPLFEMVRVGETRIALVSMPQGRRDDAFAASFQEGIADRKSTRLNSSHVKISYAV